MPDKKNLIDAYFNRHKIHWKTKVRKELKSVVSIQKFFRPSETQKTSRLDDTPTEEKSPRNRP
ncbi:MAG TPA: hypothetical protein VMU88_04960 [bacterium]|nr:hypothetical protein [bacterium]